MWVWVCDVVERGIEGVHSEFHYEWLGFKKGCRQRESHMRLIYTLNQINGNPCFWAQPRGRSQVVEPRKRLCAYILLQSHHICSTHTKTYRGSSDALC